MNTSLRKAMMNFSIMNSQHSASNSLGTRKYRRIHMHAHSRPFLSSRLPENRKPILGSVENCAYFLVLLLGGTYHRPILVRASVNRVRLFSGPSAIFYFRAKILPR